MNKELLLIKWLDHSITEEELALLNQYPEFEDYKKISDDAQLFQAPEFNEGEVFNKVKQQHQKTSSNRYWIYGIAACLALFFSLLVYTNTNTLSTIDTAVAEKTEVSLPDSSTVLLNADSKLSYDKNNWKTKRQVNLIGEAYFKVAKGKKFDVSTPQGTVSVLGTQFDVKDRVDSYEISTYEGLVQVKTKDTILQVGAGQSVIFKSGKLTSKNTLITESPTWAQGISTFKSVALKEVLNELGRQYDITLEKNSLPEEKLYTGSFPHNNLEEALQSITIPLKLNYSIRGEKTVSLGYIED